MLGAPEMTGAFFWIAVRPWLIVIGVRKKFIQTRFKIFFSVKRVVVILACLLLFATPSLACIGKTLYIGAMDRPSDKVMAEPVALLINERTGTAVQIRYMADNDALYAGFKYEVQR